MNFINNFISSFICFIHIIIILLIFIIPFVNSNYLLFSYCLIIPLIEFHWLFNNDTCALTELEKYLRNDKDKNNCFTQKIIGPIFKFNNNKYFSLYCYIILNILFSIAFSKLIYKINIGEINNFFDLYDL